MKFITELAKSFGLCETEAEELNAEIGFYKEFKAGPVKLITTDGCKKASLPGRCPIKYQLISKSVISDEVINIYTSLGHDNPENSILSDEILEEVRAFPQKN